jgi:hypothetical protein
MGKRKCWIQFLSLRPSVRRRPFASSASSTDFEALERLSVAPKSGEDCRACFVAPSEVASVAERFAATPFDTAHGIRNDRGDACTFDVMLEELDLKTEPLSRLAAIIRGADTIFLLGTFAAAFVTGLAGFAFGMVAAGIWLFTFGGMSQWWPEAELTSAIRSSH